MISFWERLHDMIAPRACMVCGKRLSPTEHVLCGVCHLKLSRTGYAATPFDNKMAHLFWGQLPVGRVAAWFFYSSQSPVVKPIHRLKYGGHPEIGFQMGEMAAREFADYHFFDDVDAILPVPLTKKRQRQRGYNQSLEIARGIAKTTKLPVISTALASKTFHESQLFKSRWQRMDNVEGAFEVTKPQLLEGKHLLIVDDVVTTGATVCEVGKQLTACGASKISVMSLGFTDG